MINLNGVRKKARTVCEKTKYNPKKKARYISKEHSIGKAPKAVTLSMIELYLTQKLSFFVHNSLD